MVSPKMVKELQASEEQKFYELIFCNIKEEDFSCLYSEIDSRPNVPVNCMVSAILLQHRQKLTYERLLDSIKFNLLTKTALGLQTLDEVPFSEASLFNFQNKLNAYFIETGINLLEREPGGVEITITQISEDQYSVSCPNQSVKAELGRKRFKAEFDLRICSSCVFASACQLQKKKSARVYYFTAAEYLKKKRLVNIQKIPKERRSLRTNVEATVSEFTRKMNNRKLKVRGRFKATIFAFAVGISVNFGRIYRYLKAKEVEPVASTA